MKPAYFSLFADCILVKGKNHSMIYDFGRGNLIKIDNILQEVLDTNSTMSIAELKKFYNNQYNDGIDAYVNLLIEKEIGFFSDSREGFQDIPMEWDSSSFIESAIIEYSGRYDFQGLIDELDELRLRSVQIRLLSNSDISAQEAVEILEKASFRSIEIYAEYSNHDEIETIKNKMKDVKTLSRFIWYNSDYTEAVGDPLESRITHTSEILYPNQKEHISLEYMMVDLKMFSESQQFNAALNRKISIDSEGKIKNYISHEKCYGIVNENNIKNIYESQSFRRLWNINKDNILKCKECPYRYACINNTDLVQEENGFWRMTNPCNLNLETLEWNQ
jgi:SPASM domain peptide maturase of grasp-with-spasm system